MTSNLDSSSTHLENNTQPPPPPPALPVASPSSVEHFPGAGTLRKRPKQPSPLPQITEYKTDSISNNRSRKTLRTVTVTTQRVRFCPTVWVNDTLSHYDMSPQEHSDYWVQTHEYLAIKQRNQRTIDAVDELYDHGHSQSQNQNDESSSSSSSDSGDSNWSSDEDPYFRGLERGLRNETATREATRLTSLEEVFSEQEGQFYAGIYDDEAIAETCVWITSHCVFRARLRAVLDRMEVKRELKTEQKIERERERGIERKIERLPNDTATPEASHKRPWWIVGRKASLTAKVNSNSKSDSKPMPKPMAWIRFDTNATSND